MLLAAILLAACATNVGVLDESRTDENIQAAFERSKHEIYGVYAKALRDGRTKLRGRVVFRITVDRDGRVVRSSIAESSLHDSTVPIDVNRIIAGMDFGRVRHPGNVTFLYPMDFIPESASEVLPGTPGRGGIEK